jgi:anaerobic ribonucleoside-triphosphate reductase
MGVTIMTLINSKEIVEEYLDATDWRVKENSNSPRNFGGLTKYLSGEVSKNYWLNSVYNQPIKRAYRSGDMHIHDLGGLTLYCCGYSLESILLLGVRGVENIPTSTPASHFASALNQIANLITVFQNEIMGAVALNSVDTLLAPFIAKDGLSPKQLRQELQNFIFSINSNSRGGAEPAFSNITLDVTPTEEMMTKRVIIGGKLLDSVYGDYQREMDMFNQVFTDLMLGGDAKGEPFAYPIITYNVGKRFDWDNPKADPIFEMAGKFGYPYFSNYINSDLEEGDLRSMCCRLRLDLTELKKRNGGLFGSGDSTGSIGVVTINLPRIGYLSRGRGEKFFFNKLDRILDLAKESLEVKRKFLQEHVLDTGLIPAFSTYVGTLDNHFCTIGDIGKNEMCENFLGVGILDKEGKDFALEVGSHILEKLRAYQVATGHLYNYEATPAESTSFRLAKKDKEKYPTIITRGTEEAPYYTNSCHIPVGEVLNFKQVYDNQDALQCQYTGGTVIHNYLNGAISGAQAKHIIKTILTKYKAPYTSLSPLNRYCPTHGYVAERVDVCPTCGGQLDMYQRITGYLRKVSNFNDGKAQEFAERNQMEVEG